MYENKKQMLLESLDALKKLTDTLHGKSKDVGNFYNAIYYMQTMLREEMTCDGCGYADKCEYAWDFYNTNGDCLASE